jgi:hypothetical protein
LRDILGLIDLLRGNINVCGTSLNSLTYYRPIPSSILSGEPVLIIMAMVRSFLLILAWAGKGKGNSIRGSKVQGSTFTVEEARKLGGWKAGRAETVKGRSGESGKQIKERREVYD